jgi:hypothetical protein
VEGRARQWGRGWGGVGGGVGGGWWWWVGVGGGGGGEQACAGVCSVQLCICIYVLYDIWMIYAYCRGPRSVSVFQRISIAMGYEQTLEHCSKCSNVFVRKHEAMPYVIIL